MNVRWALIKVNNFRFSHFMTFTWILNIQFFLGARNTTSHLILTIVGDSSDSLQFIHIHYLIWFFLTVHMYSLHGWEVTRRVTNLRLSIHEELILKCEFRALYSNSTLPSRALEVPNSPFSWASVCGCISQLSITVAKYIKQLLRKRLIVLEFKCKTG